MCVPGLSRIFINLILRLCSFALSLVCSKECVCFFVGFHFILFHLVLFLLFWYGVKTFRMLVLLHIFLRARYSACFFFVSKEKEKRENKNNINNTRICFLGNEESCQGQPLLFISLETYILFGIWNFGICFHSKKKKKENWAAKDNKNIANPLADTFFFSHCPYMRKRLLCVCVCASRNVVRSASRSVAHGWLAGSFQSVAAAVFPLFFLWKNNAYIRNFRCGHLNAECRLCFEFYVYIRKIAFNTVIVQFFSLFFCL